MKLKRTLSLLLATIFVLLCFTACSDEGEKGNEGTSSSSENVASNPQSGSESAEGPAASSEETGKYNQKTGLPEDLNYNGAEVKFISRSASAYKDELTIETNDGDPVNDAIYRRKLNTETLLGVKIIDEQFAPSGSYLADYENIDKIKTEMESSGGKSEYDIMLNPSYACIARTADGLWEDLYSVETLNLDKPYWSSLYNEEARIGGHLYFTTGDLALTLKRFIFVDLFNKRLVEKHGFEDLYQVVNENRWTLEYQSQIIENVFDNIDGDDARTENDYYGFVSYLGIQTDPYWTIWDIQILDRDDKDYVELNFNLEETDNYVNAVSTMYWKNTGMFAFSPSYGDETTINTAIRQKFASGTAVIVQLKLGEVEAQEIRSMEDKYGIIPLPKFYENDAPYYSAAHDAFTCISILRGQNADALDMSGAVLETMACQSYNVVTPAYIEVALKGKYASDPQSWDMLDNIIHNFRVDKDLLYSTYSDGTCILQMIRNTLYNNSQNFASGYSSITEKAIKKKINNLIGKIKEMHGDA